MKKVALALVAFVAVAYPAASWLVGRQLEGTLQTAYAEVERSPYVKVTERTYERGILTSHQQMTLTLALEDMARAQRGIARVETPPLPTIEVVTESSITHGPMPGFGRPAAAALTTEVTGIKADGNSIDLTKWFNGQSPLTASLTFHFDESADIQLLSPPVETDFDLGPPNGSIHLTWGGTRADIRLTDLTGSAYSVQANVPKLDLSDTKGVRMTFTGGRTTSALRRVGSGDTALLGGTGTVSFDDISFTKSDAPESQLQLNGMRYSFATPEASEVGDLETKLAATALQFGTKKYGPFRCDIALEHVDRGTVADILAAFQRAEGTRLPADAQQQAVEAIGKLLAANPSLRVDQLSLIDGAKEAKISARVGLKDAKLQDFASQQQIWSKLDATLDAEIPQEFLTLLPGQARPQAQLLILAFKGQGYVSDQGGIIKSSIVARNGGLTMNGKTLDLGALLGQRSAS